MGDENFAKGKYVSGALNKLDAFGEQTLGRGLHAIGNVFGLKASFIDDYVHDGAVSANGSPMAVSATKVTPIHDEAVAKTDPQDHAIFAKVGGPFDKLFDGVFGRINSIYEMMSGKQTRNSDPLAMGWEAFNNPMYSIQRYNRILESGTTNIGRRNPHSGEWESNMAEQMRLHSMRPSNMLPKEYDPFKGLTVKESALTTNHGQQTDGNMSMSLYPIRIEPITLNINLDGTLGKSKSFMEELTNDPMIIRSQTKLISNAISSKVNGGRSVYNGGDLVSF